MWVNFGAHVNLVYRLYPTLKVYQKKKNIATRSLCDRGTFAVDDGTDSASTFGGNTLPDDTFAIDDASGGAMVIVDRGNVNLDEEPSITMHRR